MANSDGLAGVLNRNMVRRTPTPSVVRTPAQSQKVNNLWQRDSFDSSVVAPANKSIPGYYKGQPIKSFKKGGKVKKTGIYKLHKGEVVIPKNKVKKIKKAKKSGMDLLKKAMKIK